MRSKFAIVDKELDISTAFDNFLKKKKSEGKSPDTIRAYRSQGKNFLNYCMEHKKIKVTEINPAFIDDYKTHLIDQADYTQDTRASYLRATKAFVSYLISENEIEPFAITMFRIPSKTSVSTYTDEEMKKLINCSWSKSKDFGERRDYAMMLTFLLTGARRSTIRNMRIEDIDFDNDLLTLRHIKRDNEFQIRQVPLNPDLREALMKYLKKSNLSEYSEYLFPNVEGKPQHPDTINKRLKLLFEAAGVENRGCHEFRRTYATKAYSELGDIEQTQKLMLISDPRVMSRYVNTDMKKLKESVQKLNFVTAIKSPRPLRGKMKQGA